MTDLHPFVLKHPLNDKLVFVLVLKYKSSLFVAYKRSWTSWGKACVIRAIVTAS
jgi:hypothetical protein